MASQDPFTSVRDDVKANLEQANLLVESYLRIKQTSAPNSAESTQALEDIEQIIEDIQNDLVDLEESISAIAKNPERYNIAKNEIERRRGFIANVKQELTDLKSKSQPSNPFSSAEDEEPVNQAEAEEEQYQTQIMAEQDTQLDSVFHTVGNLRTQAHTMGVELQEQSEMLQEFENAVDASTTRIKKGMQEVTQFLRRNEEKGGTCCIAVLIIVLIVLLIMVVLI